jgi:chromosomal replication initiation ATPase DnaA
MTLYNPSPLRSEKELPDRLPVVRSLKELIERIAEAFRMKPGDLKMRHRSQKFADARSVISYFAVREMGHNGEEVARMLNISPSGVSIAAGRGEEFVRKNQSLKRIARS